MCAFKDDRVTLSADIGDESVETSLLFMIAIVPLQRR